MGASDAVRLFPMGIPDQLNERLAGSHPVARRFLTAMGERLYFPNGIPSQAAEAKHTRLNASIGQITDGHGAPLPLGAMRRLTAEVDPRETYLYSTVGGTAALRDAWAARLRNRGEVGMSRPAVTSGMTHGISVLANLFVDERSTVWLPKPSWGNYRLIFEGHRGARLQSYDILTKSASGEHRFTLDGLERMVASPSGHDVVVLNFPGNPTGYTPTAEEGKEIVRLLRSHPGPLLVIVDDAYQDLVYESGLMPRSAFFELADCPPDTHLVAKVDGATKELLFFGGRVAFLTFAASGDAAIVLEEKVKGDLRATINVPSGLPQALVLAALQDPNLDEEIHTVLDLLGRRYRALKAALAHHEIACVPFNSGCFALVPTVRPSEEVRKTLLGDGIGVVAIDDHRSIRLAYCSVDENDIDALVAGIAPRVR
jgi:aspartate/methionine/tyrosine aminotransferase